MKGKRNKKTSSSDFVNSLVKRIKASSKNREQFYKLLLGIALAEGDPIKEKEIEEKAMRWLSELFNDEKKCKKQNKR